MEDFFDMVDPRRSGVDGLRGINTNEGRSRVAREMGLPENINEFNEFTRRQGANFAQPIEVDDYGKYTNWYTSRVDEKITSPIELQNLADARGRNQSRWSQLVNGTVKAITTAGTTIGSTVGTFTVGLYEFLATGDFSKLFDNEVNNWFDSLNEKIEEYIPNFYTQDQMDNPLALRNLVSMNTLADKFIKNLGFSIGSMAVGMGAGAAVKAAGSWKTFANLVQNTSKTTKVTAGLVGAMLGSVGEASIEAKQAQKEALRPIEDEHQQRLMYIEQAYKNTEMYYQLVASENARYEQQLLAAQEYANKVGDADFKANMVILPMSNYLQFGKMFARGFKTAERDFATRAGKMVVGELGDLKNTGKAWKGVTTVLGRGITEGTEEVSQQLATDASVYQYKEPIERLMLAKTDPYSEDEQISWMKAALETLPVTMGKEETWEQFLIGGLTGVVGIPMVRSSHDASGKRRSPIYLAGNALTEYNDYVKSMNEADQIVDAVNNFMKDKKYVAKFRGLIADRTLQHDMDKAAAEGNKLEYNDAEFLSIGNMVDMFVRIGRLGDFKSLLNESFDTSNDNELANIVAFGKKTVTNEDGSTTEGNLFDRDDRPIDLEDPQDKEYVKKQIDKKKKEILDVVNDFEKNSNRLDNVPGQHFSEDERSILVWGYTMLDNWRRRAESMSKNEILPVLTKIRDTMSLYKEAFGSILETGVENDEQLDNINKLLNTVTSITNFIDRASESVTDGKENLSELLFRTGKEGANVNWMKQARDIIAGDKVTKIDEAEKTVALETLDDFVKMANAYNNVSNQLAKYLTNPTALQQKIKNIQNKAEQRYNSFKGKKLKDSLNNATDIYEFRKALRESKDSQDVKDQILNEIKDSNNIAKEYLKLERAKKGVDDELALIYIKDQSVRADAMDLLNQAFGKSETADYFLDISSEPYIIEDYLNNREPDPLKRRSRHSAARVFARNAIDAYKAKESSAQAAANSTSSSSTHQQASSTSSTPGINQGNNGAGKPNPTVAGSTSSSTNPSVGNKSYQPIPKPMVPVIDDHIMSGARSTLKESVDAVDERKKQKESKDKSQYWQGFSSKHDYREPLFIKNDEGNINGINEKFYEPNPEFAGLLAYLDEGFKYVDAGKLHQGDEVSIGMHEINGTKYLIAYKKEGNRWIPLNNISGRTDERSLNSRVGLKDMFDKISEEYDKHQLEEGKKGTPYISDVTTHVDDIYMGRPHLTNELNPIDVVIGNSDGVKPVFAIMKDGRLHFGNEEGVKHDGLSYNEETLKPLNPDRNNGRLYVAVPNARQGEYDGRTTVPVIIKKLDSEWLSQGYFGEKLSHIFNSLNNAFAANDSSQIAAALNELRKYINISGYDIVPDTAKHQIVVNRYAVDSNGDVVINPKTGKPNYKTRRWFKDPTRFINDFIDHLIKEGVRYNIDINSINNDSYNKAIINSGVLSMFAADINSVGGWFTLNPIVNGKEQKATNIPSMNTSGTKTSVRTPPVRPVQPPIVVGTNQSAQNVVSNAPIKFNFMGMQYTYNNGKVIDSSGKEVTSGAFTDGVLSFAKALSGTYHSYYNGRYVYISDNPGKYRIVDVKNGDFVTPSNPVYHQILDIENGISSQGGQLRFEDENIRDIFESVGEVVSNKYAIDGVTRSNYLLYAGERKGSSIYIAMEPTFKDNSMFYDSMQAVVFIKHPDGSTSTIIGKKLNAEKADSFSPKLVEKMVDVVLNDTQSATGSMIEDRVTIAQIVNKRKEEESISTIAHLFDENGEMIDDYSYDEGFDLGDLTGNNEESIDDDGIDLEALMGDVNESGDKLFRVKYEEIEVFDKAKEQKWLEENLPNLSGEDRVKFIDGLIDVMQSGQKAWGMFDGAMMTISNVAAHGTVYHEAFHSVFHMLLNKNQRQALFQEAREQYGKDRTQIELEEAMADDFMNYVEEGKYSFKHIKRFFKNLFIKKLNWRSNRLSLYNLFRDINYGKYGNLKPNSVKLDSPRYGAEEYTQEMRNILKNALRDKEGYLLAPNGKRSKLNERQYVHVRTKAFKEWFGDWINDPANASKVVDPETKEPIVVYHGTNTPFYVFDKNKIGKRNLFGTKKKGFYFTSKKENAEKISISSHEGDILIDGMPLWDSGYPFMDSKHISSIVEYYVSDRFNDMLNGAKDPFDIEVIKDYFNKIGKNVNIQKLESYFSGVHEVFLNIRNLKIKDYNGKNLMDTSSEEFDRFIESSDDGGLLKNIVDGNMDFADTWFVNDGNNIKSATDNIGTYDKNNADIRYRLFDRKESESVTKGHLGVNKEQLISLLGSTMYTSDRQNVATKELIQNAFDAIKIAQLNGSIEKGHIKLDIDIKERTIQVSDNGIGMTPEIVQKAFFTIGGSFKGDNVDNKYKSGGLGLAKMAFLFGSDYVEVTTVKDGIKTYVKATPDDIKSDNFNIISSKTTEPNGTTVKVKIPESYINNNGEKRSIYFSDKPSFLSRPMIGNVDIEVNTTGRYRDIHEVLDKSLLPEGYISIGIATSAFGDIEIYIKPKTTDSQYSQYAVLSSGLYQFYKSFSISSGKSRFDTIINILPSVGVNDELYPMNNQREGFRKTIDPEVRDLEFLLNKINSVLEKKSITEAFGKTISMDAAKVSDVKRKTEDISSEESAKKLQTEIKKEIFKSVPTIDKTKKENTIELTSVRSEREQSEKMRYSSFDSSKIDIKETEVGAVDTSNLDITKPVFHNNTNMVIEEDGQKVITSLGELMLELKSLYLQTYSKSGIASFTGESIEDYLSKQFWGISFDKGYGGVNVDKRVMNLLAINPFYKISIYSGVDTARTLTSYIVHLIKHEFNHNFVRSEDAQFTGKFPETDAQFEGIGQSFVEWKERLYNLIKDNLETFVKYEGKYKQSQNEGESLQGAGLSTESREDSTIDDGRNIQRDSRREDVLKNGSEFDFLIDDRSSESNIENVNDEIMEIVKICSGIE